MKTFVPPELAGIDVIDDGGVHHKLAEAWAERTAVLVFVRHFG